MSKQTSGRHALKKLARFGFGFLTGCIWLFAAFMVVYTVVVILLPMLSVFAVESLSVSSDKFADVLVLAGGCTVCLSVLTALFLWKGLCWMTVVAKRFYHWLCNRWNIGSASDSDTDDSAGSSCNKKFSRLSVIVIIAAILLMIGCVVWYASSHNKDDAAMDNVSDAVENVIDGELGGSMLAPVEPYPTVDEAGLLSHLHQANTDEWVSADFDDTTDAMQSIIQSVQTADTYDSSLQIGFDVDGDIKSAGDKLLTYAGADMSSNTVANLVSDLSQSNGVFYDMSFARMTDTDGDVCWRQYNSYAGTEMAAYAPGMEIIYGDGYMYLSQVPSNPGETLKYAYAGDKVKADDATLVNSYQAGVVFEVLQSMFVNFAVDSDDVLVYKQVSNYGTSYLYEMTEQLSRGDYESVTKTVLLDCVAEGVYDVTITYVLNGTNTNDALVIHSVLDTTDVSVQLPDVDDVYFVSK